jgi:predicted nucleic acid-binding protein
VPAGALGQAWRDGRRQARLAKVLRMRNVEVVPLDDETARRSGMLCGATRTSDIIDASVVLCARARGHQVVTCDAKDLRRLDPSLALVEI